jgi:hypothetical protein
MGPNTRAFLSLTVHTQNGDVFQVGRPTRSTWNNMVKRELSTLFVTVSALLLSFLNTGSI